jgi:hypothetical protein
MSDFSFLNNNRNALKIANFCEKVADDSYVLKQEKNFFIFLSVSLSAFACENNNENECKYK